MHSSNEPIVAELTDMSPVAFWTTLTSNYRRQGIAADNAAIYNVGGIISERVQLFAQQMNWERYKSESRALSEEQGCIHRVPRIIRYRLGYKSPLDNAQNLRVDTYFEPGKIVATADFHGSKTVYAYFVDMLLADPIVVGTKDETLTLRQELSSILERVRK